jgi:hypothetical protein
MKKTHPGIMLLDDYDHYDYNYGDGGNKDG